MCIPQVVGRCPGSRPTGLCVFMCLHVSLLSVSCLFWSVPRGACLLPLNLFLPRQAGFFFFLFLLFIFFFSGALFNSFIRQVVLVEAILVDWTVVCVGLVNLGWAATSCCHTQASKDQQFKILMFSFTWQRHGSSFRWALSDCSRDCTSPTPGGGCCWTSRKYSSEQVVVWFCRTKKQREIVPWWKMWKLCKDRTTPRLSYLEKSWEKKTS